METKGKQLSDKITTNVEKVIIGKEKVIQNVLTAIVAGGHILLEDVPGTGKTKLAKALAKSMDVSFARIQFTPDLLPTDITGLNALYPVLAKMQEAPVIKIALQEEKNFAMPDDVLEQAAGANILIITRPNAPTGNTFPK